MDVILSVLRTAAQAVVGLLVAELAAHGLDVPEAVQAWIRDVLIVGGGIALLTAIVRWLETRVGDGLLARAARGLARLLLLGTGGARRPVYLAAGERATVSGDGTVIRQRRM